MSDKNHRLLVKQLVSAARSLAAEQRRGFLDDACEGLPAHIRAEVDAELNRASERSGLEATQATDIPQATNDRSDESRNDAVEPPADEDCDISRDSECEAATEALPKISGVGADVADVDAADDDDDKTVVGPQTRRDSHYAASMSDTDSPNDTPRMKFDLPRKIGRYRAEKIIGQGGFGFVFLAHDSQLDRMVALKVPDPNCVEAGWDLENYFVEARTVAQLDHPNIVPVFDVGEDRDFGFFIVSKFIDGASLRTVAEQRTFQHQEAVRLVAQVALAIHYAHTQGLVHRDIKPANILIGPRDDPYVTDFGIALREDDLGLGPRYTGSPPYMSPEQAAGEGHRVDGRSDVFGLGVVLYELLTGRRPFRADSKEALYKMIMTVDPKPMRQIDDGISKPLERVCMKALAKRASDRYTTAKDFAEDLLAICNHSESNDTNAGVMTGATGSQPSTDVSLDVSADQVDLFGDTGSTGQLTTSQQMRIVPKGMRSFDNRDADFFLKLLPGPRDRFGLPDSIRFWKTQIEMMDPDETFSVGLIYGPSGCGKSSLVKAGLLPRLENNITPVYLEATPSGTESRILQALQRRFAPLPKQLDLTEAMKQLRLGPFLPDGHKLLLVLDQFEQWLHSNEHEQSQLVSALRQCRPDRVQCIVMVRDDFWMAATSFMRQLEVRLIEDHNSNAVELFPIRHARRVLTAFGRAYGALPPQGEISDAQQAFVNAAVDGIADDGKVVCVRLALLAEMMRHKVWRPQTLKDVGGLAGLGETYLEETFMSSSAAPERRYHQVAARSVLKALLPESGTEIKRHKSYEELLELSGYAKRIDEFEQLIDILDRQLRLITPTDHEGLQQPTAVEDAHKSPSRVYQLSHDFLVPSVRSWLTRKQRETRRGRAEIRLQELANDWSLRPENRRLPTLVEWLSIRLMTIRRKWNGDEQSMMTKASKYYGLRLAGLLLVVASVVGAMVSTVRRARERSAITLAQSVVTAPARAVPYAIESLAPLAPYAISYLTEQAADPTLSRSQRLHAMCAVARLAPAKAKVDDTLRLIPLLKGEESANLVLTLSAIGPQTLEAVLSRIEAADRRQDWELKARYAVIAFQLGDTAPMADMLRLDRADPIQRTVFISALANWNGGLQSLAERAGMLADPAIVSGLTLGVGALEIDDIEETEAIVWREHFNNWFMANESVVHAASAWALRRWNFEAPVVSPNNSIFPPRQWTITRTGLTMIEVPKPKIEFVSSTQQRVDYGFAISDCEISRGLFEQFINDSDYDGDRPADWKRAIIRVSPTEAHPVQGVNWHDAMMFCNWLSHQEEKRACYERVDGRWKSIAGADGYRLATIAEWEYACRAGTSTSFSFGDDPKWISSFAVSRVSYDIAQPTGSLWPNHWGIFDLHGNVWEWVLDRSEKNVEARMHKGGAFNCQADDCLIAKAYQSHAKHGRTPFIGLRVVTAVDADPPTVND